MLLHLRGRSFFYMARPCVIDGRINQLGGEISANCAQYLAVSNIVDDFEPYEFDDDIKAARGKIDRLAGRLNYMTDSAYRITKKFNAALIKHQEKEIKRKRGKRLRQGIAMISGMAVGAAGALFTPGVGAGSIGAGVDAGQALGAAFADIIASKDDYPTKCDMCDRWRADLIEVTGYTKDPSLGDSTTFIENLETDVPFIGDSGYLYMQVLAEYSEALEQLKALREAKDVFADKAKAKR